jgi:MoxR-like ATPase
MFESIEATVRELAQQKYLADEGLATSLFLALEMGKPLFLEGEPGVGKTEVAKVLAAALDARLIRVQCYEGLDLEQAVYEWNYPRQLLELQARRLDPERGDARSEVSDLYTEEYLLRRPLLQAIDAANERSPVLLIDELDRADEEFESFLLELLADFQITIPELGTLRARHRPIVILTSNRTREIHDALKRRCIYHWIDYPSFERELEIVRLKTPALPQALARQVVDVVQRLRERDLFKLPGLAETLDWAEALTHLHASALDPATLSPATLSPATLSPATLSSTLGFLLKVQDDVVQVRAAIASGELAPAAAG